MPNYHRAAFKGGYYFFTVVTFSRRRLFSEPLAIDCFRHSWDVIRSQRPFQMIALCILPDHLHTIWRLPPGDADFSTRWASIKGVFSREYQKCSGRSQILNPSRVKKRESAIWQRRFWEHQIRDENDLQKHFNYVHYNPVKHKLVQSVDTWPYSTYHYYRKIGWYSGFVIENPEIEREIEAGE